MPFLQTYGGGAVRGFRSTGGGAASITITNFNTGGSQTSQNLYENPTVGTNYDFATPGSYKIEITGTIQFRMWCQGAGGNDEEAPGPGKAGAGHMVKGDKTFTNETITLVVGSGGGRGGSSGGWPDGGNSNSGNEGCGGGRSSISTGYITHGNINNTSTPYFLIGGGGGGATTWMTAGTPDMRAGYPSGFVGGGYYYDDGGQCDGQGGTQNAGGNGGGAGRKPGGAQGAKYYGGPGWAGGGGGGYYGGGGAGGYYAAGGGGSSYIAPSGMTNTEQWTNPSNNHWVPGGTGNFGMPSASGKGDSAPGGNGYIRCQILSVG